MIVDDTSTWAELDRATGSLVDERVAELIAGDGPRAVTEPVTMEVVAGARSGAREQDLRRLLLRFDLLSVDVAVDVDAAASIYRDCRRVGVSPRGMVDCLIAAVARGRGATLLSWDVDLDRISSVVGVELDPASLRA